MLIRLAIAACILGFPQLTRAQSLRPKVTVVSYDEGSVGERLTYLVKEQLRKSSAFDYLSDPATATSVYFVEVNTLPKDKDNPEVATIYSVVWTLRITGPKGALVLYLDSTVGYAGTNVLQSSAETIASRTDKVVTTAETGGAITR